MMIRLSRVTAALAVGAVVLGSAPRAQAQNEEWTRPFPPFKIIGNIYWVGSYDLSTYLITTPQGHILINTGVGDTAQKIKAGVEQLGFKMSDVKVILNSHGHYDHAGGIAELQKLSGAKVIASDIAAKVLRTGKLDRSDPQFNIIKPFPAVKNVEALGARGSVEVGKLKLRVIHTPGHTPGGTSWTWTSCEAERCLNVVYGDSLNAVSDDSFKYSGDPRYPNAGSDMTASIAAISAAPCDILISAHPDFTGLLTLIDEQGKGDRSQLIDSSGCKRYAATGKERFEKRLEQEAIGH